MHGTEFIEWLLYADDLVLFCPDIKQADDIIYVMNRVCQRFGLTISLKKTKIMQFDINTNDVTISVGGTVLENVTEFCYLWHTIFNNDNNSGSLKELLYFTSLVMFYVTMKYTYLSESI